MYSQLRKNSEGTCSSLRAFRGALFNRSLSGGTLEACPALLFADTTLKTVLGRIVPCIYGGGVLGSEEYIADNCLLRSLHDQL